MTTKEDDQGATSPCESSNKNSSTGCSHSCSCLIENGNEMECPTSCSNGHDIHLELPSPIDDDSSRDMENALETSLTLHDCNSSCTSHNSPKDEEFTVYSNLPCKALPNGTGNSSSDEPGCPQDLVINSVPSPGLRLCNASSHVADTSCSFFSVGEDRLASPESESMVTASEGSSSRSSSSLSGQVSVSSAPLIACSASSPDVDNVEAVCSVPELIDEIVAKLVIADLSSSDIATQTPNLPLASSTADVDPLDTSVETLLPANEDEVFMNRNFLTHFPVRTEAQGEDMTQQIASDSDVWRQLTTTVRELHVHLLNCSYNKIRQCLAPETSSVMNSTSNQAANDSSVVLAPKISLCEAVDVCDPSSMPAQVSAESNGESGESESKTVHCEAITQPPVVSSASDTVFTDQLDALCSVFSQAKMSETKISSGKLNEIENLLKFTKNFSQQIENVVDNLLAPDHSKHSNLTDSTSSCQYLLVEKLDQLVKTIASESMEKLLIRLAQLMQETCEQLKVKLLDQASEMNLDNSLSLLFAEKTCEAYQRVICIAEIEKSVLEVLTDHFSIYWPFVALHIFNVTVLQDSVMQEYIDVCRYKASLEADESSANSSLDEVGTPYSIVRANCVWWSWIIRACADAAVTAGNPDIIRLIDTQVLRVQNSTIPVTQLPREAGDGQSAADAEHEVNATVGSNTNESQQQPCECPHCQPSARASSADAYRNVIKNDIALPALPSSKTSTAKLQQDFEDSLAVSATGLVVAGNSPAQGPPCGDPRCASCGTARQNFTSSAATAPSSLANRKVPGRQVPPASAGQPSAHSQPSVGCCDKHKHHKRPQQPTQHAPNMDEESAEYSADEWTSNDSSNSSGDESDVSSSAGHADNNCDCCLCHKGHQRQSGGRNRYSERREHLLKVLSQKKQQQEQLTNLQVHEPPATADNPDLEEVINYIEGVSSKPSKSSHKKSKKQRVRKSASDRRSQQQPPHQPLQRTSTSSILRGLDSDSKDTAKQTANTNRRFVTARRHLPVGSASSSATVSTSASYASSSSGTRPALTKSSSSSSGGTKASSVTNASTVSDVRRHLTNASSNEESSDDKRSAAVGNAAHHEVRNISDLPDPDGALAELRRRAPEVTVTVVKQDEQQHKIMQSRGRSTTTKAEELRQQQQLNTRFGGAVPTHPLQTVITPVPQAAYPAGNFSMPADYSNFLGMGAPPVPPIAGSVSSTSFPGSFNNAIASASPATSTGGLSKLIKGLEKADGTQGKDGKDSQMVTIRRVMDPMSSEPTVTISLKGEESNQEKVLYKLVNGQAIPGEALRAPLKSRMPDLVPPSDLNPNQIKKWKKKQKISFARQQKIENEIQMANEKHLKQQHIEQQCHMLEQRCEQLRLQSLQIMEEKERLRRSFYELSASTQLQAFQASNTQTFNSAPGKIAKKSRRGKGRKGNNILEGVAPVAAQGLPYGIPNITPGLQVPPGVSIRPVSGQPGMLTISSNPVPSAGLQHHMMPRAPFTGASPMASNGMSMMPAMPNMYAMPGMYSAPIMPNMTPSDLLLNSSAVGSMAPSSWGTNHSAAIEETKKSEGKKQGKTNKSNLNKSQRENSRKNKNSNRDDEVQQSEAAVEKPTGPVVLDKRMTAQERIDAALRGDLHPDRLSTTQRNKYLRKIATGDYPNAIMPTAPNKRKPAQMQKHARPKETSNNASDSTQPSAGPVPSPINSDESDSEDEGDDDEMLMDQIYEVCRGKKSVLTNLCVDGKSIKYSKAEDCNTKTKSIKVTAVDPQCDNSNAEQPAEAKGLSNEPLQKKNNTNDKKKNNVTEKETGKKNKNKANKQAKLEDNSRHLNLSKQVDNKAAVVSSKKHAAEDKRFISKEVASSVSKAYSNNATRAQNQEIGSKKSVDEKQSQQSQKPSKPHLKQAQPSQKPAQSAHKQTHSALKQTQPSQKLFHSTQTEAQPQQKQVQSQQKQVQPQQKQVQQQQKQVQQQQKQVQQQQKQVQQQQKQVQQQQKQVQQQQKQVQQQQKQVQPHQKQAQPQQKQIQPQQKQIQSQQKQVQPQQKQVQSQQKQVQPQQKQIQPQQKQVQPQQKQVQPQQKQVHPQQKQVQPQQKQVQPQQKQIQSQQKQVHPQQKQIQPQQKQVQPQQKQVQPQQKPVQPQQKQVQNQQKQVQNQQKQVQPQQKQVQPQQKQVQPQQKQVQPQQKQVQPQQKQVQPQQKQVQPTQKQVQPTQKQVQPTQKQVQPTQKQIQPTQKQVQPAQKQIQSHQKQVPPQQRQVHVLQSQKQEVAQFTKEAECMQKVPLTVQHKGNGHASIQAQSNVQQIIQPPNSSQLQASTARQSNQPVLQSTVSPPFATSAQTPLGQLSASEISMRNFVSSQPTADSSALLPQMIPQQPVYFNQQARATQVQQPLQQFQQQLPQQPQLPMPQQLAQTTLLQNIQSASGSFDRINTGYSEPSVLESFNSNLNSGSNYSTPVNFGSFSNPSNNFATQSNSYGVPSNSGYPGNTFGTIGSPVLASSSDLSTYTSVAEAAAAAAAAAAIPCTGAGAYQASAGARNFPQMNGFSPAVTSHAASNTTTPAVGAFNTPVGYSVDDNHDVRYMQYLAANSNTVAGYSYGSGAFGGLGAVVQSRTSPAGAIGGPVTTANLGQPFSSSSYLVNSTSLDDSNCTYKPNPNVGVIGKKPRKGRKGPEDLVGVYSQGFIDEATGSNFSTVDSYPSFLDKNFP